MDRRMFLAGAVASTILSAGCLSAGENGSSDSETNAESRAAAFEQCPHRIVRVSDLPSPAESEALEAINEQETQIDGDPYLPAVIDIDSAYLRYEDQYYAVEHTETDNGVQLALIETLPTFRESVVLENQTESAVAVDVQIEHKKTDELLVEKTVELSADEQATLNSDVTFPYGTYQAEFDVEQLPDDGSWEPSWELNWAYETGDDYPLELDENGVFVDPTARNTNYGPCSWDDDGSVTSGDH